MKTLILVPVAVSLLVNIAHADGGAGPTLFTGWEIELANKAPTEVKPMTPTGAPILLFGSSQNRGTSLFPPNSNEGANN